ncbi:MAG TPA: prepilin-type N-terminal cleavage/methylation domain-containing protein [Candidatus Krumholzibacteria bacterium]|nr:prepilin-type N-terminal cleavage/methylation domain-containing protein [Candidatus Krumholzibacteria bacterium]
MRWRFDEMRNERGVSLLEIMVALVIFGIGLVVAVRTLPESNAKTTQSRNRSIAVNLAQEGIEELMGRPFNNADLTAGVHVDPENPIRNHFARQWEVTDATPVAGMKMISVSVSFPTAGVDSVATLRTFKTMRQ